MEVIDEMKLYNSTIILDWLSSCHVKKNSTILLDLVVSCHVKTFHYPIGSISIQSC